MRKKTIILVTNTLGNGGAQRVQVELINQWIKSGLKVIVIQTENKKQYNYYTNEAIDIININSSKNRIRRYYMEIKQICKIMNMYPDATVLAFVIHSIFLVSICSFFASNKIVFSERNDPQRWPKSRLRRFLRDKAFERADYCVFQSDGAKAHFSERIQNKSVIISNPINPELPPISTEKREKVIITASRLEKQKNIPMLIDAFQKFHVRHTDYTLEIYGRGKDEDKIRSYIQKIGMTDSIMLKGYSNNIYQEMNRCSIFALSSDFEGVSNSMLEALAMGLPAVVTDCPPGGARQIITNGVNGLLVPVGDSDAMSHAFCKFVENPNLTEKIAIEASKIRRRYPIEKVSEEWIEVLNEKK